MFLQTPGDADPRRPAAVRAPDRPAVRPARRDGRREPAGRRDRRPRVRGRRRRPDVPLAPYEYEDNTHLFLGYAFHNWWDRAHERPQNPQLPPARRPGRSAGSSASRSGSTSRASINTAQEDIETTWAVALADLGEPPAVLDGGEAYLGEFDGVDRPLRARAGPAARPHPRPVPRPTCSTSVRVERRHGDGRDHRPRPGAPAARPRARSPTTCSGGSAANIDYTFDAQLGWISLASSLTDSDLIAVAYQYETLDGRLVTVGDYGRPAQSTSQTGPRTILKLIRADRPTPDRPAVGPDAPQHLPRRRAEPQPDHVRARPDVRAGRRRARPRSPRPTSSRSSSGRSWRSSGSTASTSRASPTPGRRLRLQLGRDRQPRQRPRHLPRPPAVRRLPPEPDPDRVDGRHDRVADRQRPGRRLVRRAHAGPGRRDLRPDAGGRHRGGRDALRPDDRQRPAPPAAALGLPHRRRVQERDRSRCSTSASSWSRGPSA